MKSFLPSELKTPELHGILLGSIGPRPIAFASTMDADGKPNLSPYSFFNVFSANPPIMIFSPARRVRNNTTKHTLENIEKTKEVVINVVNWDIVQQMSLSSTEYEAGVNEFEKSGLNMLKSDIVKPYRVKESPVQYECKVNEIVHLGKEGGAGNLIISEVVKVHVREDLLDDNLKIDQHKIDLVARMGGNWYSRANQGMFEVEKPLSTLGIGVDKIPEYIRFSKTLTGNDLGKLANVERLPDAKAVKHFVESNELANFMEESSEEKIQIIAQEYLNKNEVDKAWKILLAKQ
ncbi:flavin reductase family protein [Psychroflexus aestuariivivens]|uniref:flavin reductase family protein n=1 Tax=Psychroflexus aestuariivivens TaxID=1795040 RepID=UPI000FDADFB8|nr:flavin reductase family protein [Psychroflexus aestuariivivens]